MTSPTHHVPDLDDVLDHPPQWYIGITIRPSSRGSLFTYRRIAAFSIADAERLLATYTTDSIFRVLLASEFTG